MNVAKIKRDNYMLYLVDRQRISERDYIPEIIYNPSKNILESDEWLREIDKYFIVKL